MDVAATPLMASDASGNVAWKENYRPYGDKLNNQLASMTNTVGYAGKPYDNQTGLSYMGARYYHPVLGRFTGIDPVGFNPDNVHSFNRYAYANNNPYKFVDPDGRSPIVTFGIGFAVGFIADFGATAITGGWDKAFSQQGFTSAALNGVAKGVNVTVGNAAGVAANLSRITVATAKATTIGTSVVTSLGAYVAGAKLNDEEVSIGKGTANGIAGLVGGRALSKQVTELAAAKAAMHASQNPVLNHIAAATGPEYAKNLMTGTTSSAVKNTIPGTVVDIVKGIRDSSYTKTAENEMN